MAQPAFASDTASTQQVRPARPIDLVHLAKQCLGDENLELEVLRLFDTTLATYFARARAAATADDLLINIHSVRGASAGVGAFAVADLAKTMETDLREGRALAPERFDDLGIAVEEARDFIGKLLANAPD